MSVELVCGQCGAHLRYIMIRKLRAEHPQLPIEDIRAIVDYCCAYEIDDEGKRAIIDDCKHDGNGEFLTRPEAMRALGVVPVHLGVAGPGNDWHFVGDADEEQCRPLCGSEATAAEPIGLDCGRFASELGSVTCARCLELVEFKRQRLELDLRRYGELVIDADCDCRWRKRV